MTVLETDLRQLDASITADPSAPRVVGVRAPGGYGKTALLTRWAQLYRDAGVPVYDGRHELPARDAAVLVDDAHRLDDDRLRALRGLAVSGSAQLAVAYRPWPRRAALTELVDAVTRVRPPVLLGPLNRTQIGERAGLLLGSKPSDDLVNLVGEQTGGVPRFVDRLVRAVSETPDCSVPATAVEAFRYEVENLDEGVRRLLLATALGAGLRTDLLASLLGLDLEALGDAMDGARASGLVDDYGMLLPIAQRALVALSPWERRLGLHQRLIEIQLARSGPLLPLVRPLLIRPLLGEPVSGPLFASAFKAAGDEALAESPALAAQLFAAAVDAGEPALALAARRAEAAALSGDLDGGLRLADQAIAAEAAADRAHGASVAAAVLAHRGLLGSSTELYRWAGEGSAVPFAALGLIGTGRLAEADELLSQPGSGGPPTLLAGAARQLAQGIRESVTGSATTALATLTRAAVLIEPLGRNVLLPDTPAALAALVAMHCGEFAVAESVLRRAIDSGMGGAIALRRHLLLRGWTAMLRGGFDAARADLVAAATATGPVEPRDWLLATGLEIGLARRDSDLSALRTVWDRAREAIVRHPADLFALLPLGELAVAAGRLHDTERLAPHLGQATELLQQLGNPPLWSTSLSWNRMHAAVLDEHPEDAGRHAADLAAFAPAHPYCAAVADAARVWVRLLAGDVDADETESSARALAAAGLVWDGARLAGQAAIRTTDRTAMVALLDCARIIQGRQQEPTQETPLADSATTLSDREREVAELVVSGLTYKQIGEKLFISAKTVEYHVARMRQRLGSDTRSDLLNQLRGLLGTRA
ncbi:helix-turn-helix transcriptional regulator [Kutzneria sp. CA-103260]|uniref:helix-turn-helix transcriptional regulator n=1 Tax=Kutzneria sp. CA-103260 TaxID=2802641 RepID=UPI001BEEAB12|nr:LuxR C-terminal-related transcriptional regulator [Kutzneria sp. CA-103260]QUQ67634.1 LuxR family transcriptional regulator [Kutzneria sp. CA-103260]